MAEHATSWPIQTFRGTKSHPLMPNYTDNQLLDLARRGDRRAVETLLERHQAQVYRFGMRMCRDPEDAKDVLQDTLLSMARGVGDFRGASSISTWLFRIARSACIKKRRQSKFAPTQERSLDDDTHGVELPLTDPAQSPEEALASKEIGRALEKAIRTLAPIYREVLLLRDVEGLTAPEAAEVLSVSIATVKSRLHRARLSIRAVVAPSMGFRGDEATEKGACPDVLTLFSQHLEDEISVDVCAAMERHLQACERCRDVCESLKQTLALCRTTAPTVQVPSVVQASVKVALRNFLAENA